MLHKQLRLARWAMFYVFYYGMDRRFLLKGNHNAIKQFAMSESDKEKHCFI